MNCFWLTRNAPQQQEEAGADVNAPGEHLPIVKALRRLHDHPDDTAILELLLRHGADPNKMHRGHNGFFQAVENGSPELLELVMSRSLVPIDLTARDDAGMTVLEVAASRGWHEGRTILLQGAAEHLLDEESSSSSNNTNNTNAGAGANNNRNAIVVDRHSPGLRPAPAFSATGGLSRANTGSTTTSGAGPRGSTHALNNAMNNTMR